VNGLIMLHTVNPAEILRVGMQHSIPVRMSIFSGGLWHLLDVAIKDVRPDAFDVEIKGDDKEVFATLEAGGSVGIALRHNGSENNFIFDTVIIAVKSASGDDGGDGAVLAIPEGIELIGKRSYERVKVPAGLDVSVKLWSRSKRVLEPSRTEAEVLHSLEGKLIEVSAGGMQLSICSSQGPSLNEGDFIGLEFQPSRSQSPLRLNAYVRNILRPGGEGDLVVGLEMVGLEASAEGRMSLARLCSVMDEYRGKNEEEAGEKNDGQQTADSK